LRSAARLRRARLQARCTLSRAAPLRRRASAMAKSRPALLTAALRAAGGLGYLGYRFLLPPAPQTEGPEGPAGAVHVARDGEPGADESADEAERATTLREFGLDSLAGGPQSIKSWPGKPLLINFWATWCGPCLREIPMLKEFQAGHSDLQVVGIAVDKRDPVV